MNIFRHLRIWLINCFYLLLLFVPRMLSSSSANDIFKCNYGIHDDTNFGDRCYCDKVLGDGNECKINKSSASGQYEVIFLCLSDNSTAWLRNIKIQIENGIIFEEQRENYVRGFVKDLIHFEVYYFCNKIQKTKFPWPQSNSQRIEKTGNETVYTKEELRKSYEDCQKNKKPSGTGSDYNPWIVLVVFLVILVIILACLFIYRLHQKKIVEKLGILKRLWRSSRQIGQPRENLDSENLSMNQGEIGKEMLQFSVTTNDVDPTTILLSKL